jgi:hypothetical protein
MLSRRICVECNKGRSCTLTTRRKGRKNGVVELEVASWSCPYALARDCRLRTMLDKSSEPPERCPMKLEHVVETQDAEA